MGWDGRVREMRSQPISDPPELMLDFTSWDISLNSEREIQFPSSSFMQNRGHVPSLKEGNSQETIFSPPWRHEPVAVGLRFGYAFQEPASFVAIRPLFEDERYMVTYNPTKDKVYALLKDQAKSDDILKAAFHLARIQREDPQPMPDADELEGAQRLAHLAFAEQGELSRYCLSSSASPPRSDLPPLLRCCLLLLPILDAGNPDLAVRCGRRLLAFLRTILSRDPDPSLLPALEVFVENVVVSDRLRRCFTRADGAILKGSRVSTMAMSCWSELHVVLELMSHHFISSVQGEGGFEQFLSALSWSGKAAEGTPEIGLPGAISLVHRGCLFSMPVVVQAHFVLLASRCVGNGDLDPHLLAFENAMNAYLRYLPALGVFYRTSGVISPLSYFAKKRPFNSCIQDTTNQKLSCQISRLLSFCKLHSDDDLHTNERDIFDIAVRFIEENQHLVHEQFRQQVVIAVKRIVSNILGCAKQKEMHELDDIVSEEIICLAAVLRLMGSSFLQILYCIRQMRVADGRKNENYLSLCKVYSFISEAIRLLGPYEANELHRHDLFGMIGKPVDRERASMLMLAHFTSLSVCCLRMRFGFLWKGCIIMMMVAMNLLIAEEEILGLCLGGSKDSAISSVDQEGNLKDSARRKFSTVVALQFSNLQKVHIQDEIGHDFGEGSSLGTLRRCKSRDGGGDVRSFFECLPEYKRNSSEWNDIKDFVECKAGMDYSNWWTQHKKFKKYMDKKWIRSKRLGVNKNKRMKPSRGNAERSQHPSSTVETPRTPTAPLPL